MSGDNIVTLAIAIFIIAAAITLYMEHDE